MSKKADIVRLADFPRKPDPIVEARKRLEEADAREDGDAAIRAARDIERGSAPTLEGVLVKVDHLWTYFEAMMEGDTLTAQGEVTVRALYHSIRNAIGGFAARATG